MRPTYHGLSHAGLAVGHLSSSPRRRRRRRRRSGLVRLSRSGKLQPAWRHGEMLPAIQGTPRRRAAAQPWQEREDPEAGAPCSSRSSSWEVSVSLVSTLPTRFSIARNCCPLVEQPSLIVASKTTPTGTGGIRCRLQSRSSGSRVYSSCESSSGIRTNIFFSLQRL